MQKIKLYRYEINGRVTVTPNAKNELDEPSRMRLIAEDGYVLTDGENKTPAVDIAMEDIGLWSEIVDAEELSETELKAQAYDILMGVSE